VTPLSPFTGVGLRDIINCTIVHVQLKNPVNELYIKAKLLSLSRGKMNK
jgi:hypothetical protein